MISIDKLSDKIGNKIANELNYDNEKKEVIIYGIFAIIQILASILFTAIIGTFLGVCIEAVIISFVIAIFRKYSGGIHANTSNKCIIIGALICAIPICIINKNLNYITLNYIIIFTIGVFVFSYYIVYKYAPVDTPNKPIKKLEKRKKLKKRAIFILCVYLVLVLISIFRYKYTLNVRFLLYALSILIGTLWQTFTLTKLAQYIFKN